jgi:prepilin-type N-terminal cleavage/methylation domain-containing protein
MKRMHKKQTLRKAFTLIEMLIVMSIIGLLAALTLGISSSVMRNSEIRQTENALKVLSMAMQEWELEMGRLVTFQGVPVENDTNFYDLGFDQDFCNLELDLDEIDYPEFGGEGVSNEIMQVALYNRSVALFALLSQSDGAKTVLSKIESDLLGKLGTEKYVIDAWGNPIGVVFPGKYYTSLSGPIWGAEDTSGDLTVRDQVEDGLGSCINQMPYFVSAGPDGIWGYRFQAGNGPILDDPASMTIWNATLDNIYSYTPFIVEGAR